MWVDLKCVSRQVDISENFLPDNITRQNELKFMHEVYMNKQTFCVDDCVSANSHGHIIQQNKPITEL